MEIVNSSEGQVVLRELFLNPLFVNRLSEEIQTALFELPFRLKEENSDGTTCVLEIEGIALPQQRFIGLSFMIDTETVLTFDERNDFQQEIPFSKMTHPFRGCERNRFFVNIVFGNSSELSRLSTFRESVESLRNIEGSSILRSRENDIRISGIYSSAIEKSELPRYIELYDGKCTRLPVIDGEIVFPFECLSEEVHCVMFCSSRKEETSGGSFHIFDFPLPRGPRVVRNIRVMEELKRYSIHLIAVSEGKESIVCLIPCPRWRKYIDLMRWRGCESEIPYGLRLDRVKYGDFFLRVRLFTSKGERAPQQPQIIARLQKLSRNRELESTKELPLYTPEHFDFSGEKIELIPRRDFTLSYDEYRISVSPQF